MGPNALLIIIGSGFVLLGVAGIVGSKWISVILRTKFSRGVVAVLGVGMLVLGVVRSQTTGNEGKGRADTGSSAEEVHPPPQQKPHEQPFAILNPSNRASVGADMVVEGSYPQSITDDVWVIVWPEQARGKGWPQSDNAASEAPALKQNGRWSVACHFGGSPQGYDIAVYTATASASRFLGDKTRLWFDNKKYPGISVGDMPPGLTEKSRIRVTKSE